MSALQRGDVVAVEARALGQLARVYVWLTGTDTLTVTRIDRAAGRKTVYARKVGAAERVLVAWPEQLKLVRRAPAAPRRSR